MNIIKGLLILKNIIVLGFLFFAIESSASALHEQISICSTVSDDLQRLACYDRINNDDKMNREQLDQSGSWDVIKTVPADSGKSLKSKGRWLDITPYRRNYILPVSYNDNAASGSVNGNNQDFVNDDIEVKFQLSFEMPLWEKLFHKNLDLYFAYTQLSFFQAYNKEYSSPFRETVYEPELGFKWQPDFEYLGWKLESARIAYNHQSNGRTKPLSRSWDRVITQFKIRNDDLSLGMRVWKRIDAVPDNDDNPDIVDYLGYGEIFAGYDVDRHRFGLMLRNPLDHEAIQVDWSYLFSKKVRLYMQYFNGYGESLIDYDQRVNRIGIGFMLNDWL